MGCNASHIIGGIGRASKTGGNEDSLQCKNRSKWIAKAVDSRNKFAAAHSQYLYSLRNVGAAFRQFGESAGFDSISGGAASSSGAAAVIHPPPSPPPESESSSPPHYDHPVPPQESPPHYRPPPPPPNFWDELTRSYEADIEREEQQVREQVEPVTTTTTTAARENITSSKDKEWGIIPYMPSPASGNAEFLEVLNRIDDFFLEAHESGKKVSRLLEATRVHYDSNFVDTKAFQDSNRGKVWNALSLTKSSSKNPKLKVADDGTEESESNQNHAATLNKILAWENKLYGDVKTIEKFKTQHIKEKQSLGDMEANQAQNGDAIELKRSIIKELETKTAVALKGAGTAIDAINDLKIQLHDQLIRLLQGLIEMWKTLEICHKEQFTISNQMKEMKAIDNWEGIQPTSAEHRRATEQLGEALSKWCTDFQGLISSQREYVDNLSKWLEFGNQKLAMERVQVGEASWKCTSSLEICREWRIFIDDRLPGKVAVQAIKDLETVVHELHEKQAVELRHREQVDTLNKELEYKMKQQSSDKFVEKMMFWRKKKHILHPGDAAAASTTMESSENDNSSSTSSSSQQQEDDEISWTTNFLEKQKVSNRESIVDILKKKVEAQAAEASKATSDTRVSTLNNMQTLLPSIFQTLQRFSRKFQQAYKDLHSRGHQAVIHRIGH